MPLAASICHVNQYFVKGKGLVLHITHQECSKNSCMSAFVIGIVVEHKL